LFVIALGDDLRRDKNLEEKEYIATINVAIHLINVNVFKC